MKNLQEVTERVCELKGSHLALEALMPAVLEVMPPGSHRELMRLFEAHSETARTVLLHSEISEHVIGAFERDVRRTRAVLAGTTPEHAVQQEGAEAILLTTTRISTFQGTRGLSGASGFFFRREGRLYLVTSRHVMADVTNQHLPDRIEIELHTDTRDLTRYVVFSLPLYSNGRGLWRQAEDTGGDVDVAVLEIDVQRLPEGCVLRAFDPGHLHAEADRVEVGDALAIVGFPLGFHDTVHHLPVVRQASIASAYGVRFQQKGYFLTDARTHRGSSGAPVLRRLRAGPLAKGPLPWQLLGVHSTRMDMRTRDRVQDESLGLNCAWYADVLMALTADPAQQRPAAQPAATDESARVPQVPGATP